MKKTKQLSLFLMPILMLISGNMVCAQDSNNSNGPEAYELLFIGNSHSRVGGLPELVAILIRTGLPGKTANATAAPGLRFLSDRLGDGVTEPLLFSRPWTHVVLQGQKYSSSGSYDYPTDAAEVWIRLVKQQNARPILFPEWARKGNADEGISIHNLHVGISSRESACVAPIGLAWEESITRYPVLDLYAPDENHSNLNGALLSAYVFYELFTGQLADDLPYIPEIDVSASIQQDLKKVASFVVAANRSTCIEQATTNGDILPGDPHIPTLQYWGLVALFLFMAGFGGWSLRRKSAD